MIIRPEGTLQILSQQEAQQLSDTSDHGLHELVRQCALAVLNTGSHTDDTLALLKQHPDFDIQVAARGRGVQIILSHPPETALVEGELITGIKHHLFAVLRDLVYTRNDILDSGRFNLDDSAGITHAVFHILRNARLLVPGRLPNIVVCWGGHRIVRNEYDYAKYVGYEMGLRGLDICTGCGLGAMKGPMKGAAVGHHKQRINDGRFIGLSEPGIIAVEPPNPVVTELCILPDIEKRLEAFVRLGHGIVIFPGGAGTLEEIFYLIAILLHPANCHIALPVILTGPEGSQEYFSQLLHFLELSIGLPAQARLTYIHNDAIEVAREMKMAMETVRTDRRNSSDAYYFNWRLHLALELQRPFIPTHENMAALNLSRRLPPHKLAAEIRKAFSGIVAGSVKAPWIRAIEQKGPYRLHGDADLLEALEALVQSLIDQGRLKPHHPYPPVIFEKTS
ncbi:MAG TPA: LOG family protein [Sulfurivirga caldicuralii]|nr:LOG family protein [Sulfurivirga caldicuralii]